jgi:signal peptidase I
MRRTDRRPLSAVGHIPLENIIGRASLLFFSRADGKDGAPRSVRCERIGMAVR